MDEGELDPQSAEARRLLAEGVVSVKEAQEFSRLSHQEIYNRMNDGSLKYVRHGKRRLIPRVALIEMLSRGLSK